MQKNKLNGPVLTLAAVAVLGGGIWVANVAQKDAPTVPTPVATATPAPPPVPSTPPPAAFPAQANYVGTIPSASGNITLEVTVSGRKAIAYACDGDSVEVWLRGTATNGLLALVDKGQTSRMDAHLDGDSLAGTLTLGQKSWDFTAAPVVPPGGLYVSEKDGVRSSWIVDDEGTVTGVQRRADGSTGPAPALWTDGTAVKVEGDGDVD